MGYMGFGMRKSVYTRKPKKAFKKVKDAFGDPKLTKDEQKSYKPGKIYPRRRFKHFYQTKAWKISLWTIAGLFVLSIIITEFVEPIYWEYKQAEFEENGIIEYYNNKSDEFDKIANFFLKRRDKIISLENAILINKRLIIKKNVAFTNKDSLTNFSWNSESKYYSINIKNGLLIKQTDTSSVVINGNWISSISFEELDDIDPAILEYLNTTKAEFQLILDKINTNDLEVNSTKNGIGIDFQIKHFGLYTLQYAAKSQAMGNSVNVRTGKVRDNVYWVKNRRTFLYR